MKKILLFILLLLAPVNAWAEEDEIFKFFNATESSVMANRFDALDAMGADLRITGAHFQGSHLKLYHFYGALSAFSGDDCGCSGAGSGSTIAFAQKEAALKQWLVQRPQSLTAHVAMANLLIRYAWAARTGKYAALVGPDQWKLYGERMREADAYLKGIDPKSDPYIYIELMSISDAQPSPRENMDKVYVAATRNYPDFFHFYADRADKLQQKWYGEAGELASFTRSLLVSPGGENGQIAYTYAASRLASEYYDDAEDIYGDTGLTWPLVKSAYAVREKRYGLLISDWNILLYFAECANDRQAAIDILGHIGDRWSTAFWKDRSRFDAVVAWAHTK